MVIWLVQWACGHLTTSKEPKEHKLIAPRPNGGWGGEINNKKKKKIKWWDRIMPHSVIHMVYGLDSAYRAALPGLPSYQKLGAWSAMQFGALSPPMAMASGDSLGPFPRPTAARPPYYYCCYSGHSHHRSALDWIILQDCHGLDLAHSPRWVWHPSSMEMFSPIFIWHQCSSAMITMRKFKSRWATSISTPVYNSDW